MPSTPPAKDGETRYVFVELPRCPYCGGMKLRSYGTRRDAEGTVTRYTRCAAADCGRSFIIVAEPAIFRNPVRAEEN